MTERDLLTSHVRTVEPDWPAERVFDDFKAKEMNRMLLHEELAKARISELRDQSVGARYRPVHGAAQSNRWRWMVRWVRRGARP